MYSCVHLSIKEHQFYKSFFFIDPTPKLVCLALGNPSDQQHCTIAHISIAPPLFEVYNGLKVCCISVFSLRDLALLLGAFLPAMLMSNDYTGWFLSLKF